MRCNSSTRTATSKDLRFVVHLQRKFTDAVGFIPIQGIKNALLNRRIIIADENDDAAGYMLVRPQLSYAPGIRLIVQAAVAMDAQRRRHGLALLHRLASHARDDGMQMIQATVAEDLDSNAFFAAAGFIPVFRREDAVARERTKVIWRKPLELLDRASLMVPPTVAERDDGRTLYHGPGGKFISKYEHAHRMLYRMISPQERKKLLALAA